MKLLGQKRSITDAPQSAATSSDRRLELRKYMATGSGSDSAMIRHVNNIPPDLVIQQSNHVGNAHVSASSSAFFDRR
ncbi:hypothetical protein EON65_00855 [archaeon]|nr:MAG: hypothetical protein EON65_00855 [archaeon]